MAEVATATLKNILVIGETGVGKSSVLNLLLGENLVETSSSTERGTFSTKKYCYNEYILVDTVGYNDIAEGNSTEALTNLAKAAKDLSAGGISLIIYVMKKGRVTKASKTNYDYFVNNFCVKKVPVLLVITHCEEEGQMGKWYESIRTTFVGNGMIFTDSVSGCCIDLRNTADLDPDMVPIYKKKRDQTQQDMKTKIEKWSLKDPWNPPINSIEWISSIIMAAAAAGFMAIGAPGTAAASLAVGLGSFLANAVVNALPKQFWK